MYSNRNDSALSTPFCTFSSGTCARAAALARVSAALMTPRAHYCRTHAAAASAAVPRHNVATGLDLLLP